MKYVVFANGKCVQAEHCSDGLVRGGDERLRAEDFLCVVRNNLEGTFFKLSVNNGVHTVVQHGHGILRLDVFQNARRAFLKQGCDFILLSYTKSFSLKLYFDFRLIIYNYNFNEFLQLTFFFSAFFKFKNYRKNLIWNFSLYSSTIEIETCIMKA